MRKIRVLLVEDNKTKRQKIRDEVETFFHGNVAIDPCDNFSQATQKIFQNEYELMILDLLLPRRKDDDPSDISGELLEHVAASEPNRLATCVAISEFGQAIEQHQIDFTKAGILLVKYGPSDDWKSCLNVCMQRVANKSCYDFVVLCALVKERDAFEYVKEEGFALGDYVTSGTMNGREISLGELKGICIVQAEMGLVDAGVLATKALDEFAPSLICMSGICGGFPRRAKLGGLIVSGSVWDHQAGKWTGKEFELRDYRENLETDVRIALSQLVEDDPKLIGLRDGISEEMLPLVEAKLGPSVSGSAVIASTFYGEKIAKSHGKVAAVDMEVYALYRAAKLHGRNVKFFAAKTVVDLANEDKDDDYQHYGAVLSARFVTRAIRSVLA